MAATWSRIAWTLGAAALVAGGCASDPPDTESPTPPPATATDGANPTPTATQPGGGDTPTQPAAVTPTVTPDPVLGRCDNSFPAPASGLCEVTEGGAAILLQGDLILPDGILEAGEVLIMGDAILCAGCDCHDEAEASGATVVSCPDSVVSPGLINAHDHITYTEGKPIAHGTERYDHRNEWRRGLNGKTKLTTPQNANGLGDAWGEMRQIVTGTTSLFGSGTQTGFLRNLDRTNGFEGLSHQEAEYDTFPLGDGSFNHLVSEGCDEYEIDPVDFDSMGAYVPHVAEGVNDAARNEFLCMAGLQSGGVDYVTGETAFIHGIGVWAADIGLMAVEGTAVVWSPRSNTDLYGLTAEVPTYARLGAQIALGTDWTYSGSVNVLRELACAESWSDNYWNGAFSDQQLVAMATHQAADVLGFGDVLGSLVRGKAADITVWDGRQHEGYRAILDASPADVALVLRGGEVMYGDAGLVADLAGTTDCELLAVDGKSDVCGTAKRLCAMREIGITASALDTQLGSGVYDLFFCAAPSDEPSCTPLRPGEFDGQKTSGDRDGDGVANAADSCPDHFNPPRLVDGDAQADFDGDGVGDVCDPCPLDANTTSCTAVDPNDFDGDGAPNATDNCLDLANPGQEDADNDGTGDACDECPDEPNPGGRPCPATIYEAKNGTLEPGDGAFLEGNIVTAAVDDGFFLTVDPDSEDYDGPEYASLFVYNPGTEQPEIGSRVDISGILDDYFGQLQLSAGDLVVSELGVTVPAPTLVDPEAVAPGGADEKVYEGSLVTVEDVEVLDNHPAGAEGETGVANELIVTGDLTIDDEIYLIQPFPIEGQVLASVTGVLNYTWSRNKMLPRFEADVDLGPPAVVGVSAAEAFIYEGDTGVTSPVISVRLSTQPEAPLFIPVTSSDEGVVTVVGGGVTVAAGELSADIQVTGVAEGGPVTLTVQPDDAALTASVTVLGVAAQPVPVSLDPDEADLKAESELVFTVTLDLPAPPSGVTLDIDLIEIQRDEPTPTPTPTATDTPPAATDTPPTATEAPVPATETPTPTAGDPTVSPTATPEPTQTGAPTPTAGPTPTAAPTPTAIPTPTATPTPTPTATVPPGSRPLATAPATVTVLAGQTTATFTLIAGAIPGVVQVDVSGGDTTVSSTVTITPPNLLGLLLVEVFPNPDSTDNDKEWVKLYNGSGRELDLSGWSLGYGGGRYTAFTKQLTGTVAAGACFTVGGPITEASNGSPTYDQVSSFAGNLQNSDSASSPRADAVGLFNVVATAITADTLPIDAMAYGHGNTDGFKAPDGSLLVPQVDGAPSGQAIVRTSPTTWEYAAPNASGCVVIQ